MKKKLSVTVDENIVDKVDEIAKKTKRPVSYVVEWSLKHLITKENIEEKLEAMKKGVSSEALTEKHRTILQKVANEILNSVRSITPSVTNEQMREVNTRVNSLIKELWDKVE